MESRARFEDADASRRTQLANERTFLAWWRSGLTALGVGLAVGRVVPEIGHQTRWPYAVLGTVYALFGLGLMAYGSIREREVVRGIERGRFVPADRLVLACFVGLIFLISVGTITLILISP